MIIMRAIHNGQSREEWNFKWFYVNKYNNKYPSLQAVWPERVLLGQESHSCMNSKNILSFYILCANILTYRPALNLHILTLYYRRWSLHGWGVISCKFFFSLSSGLHQCFQSQSWHRWSQRAWKNDEHHHFSHQNGGFSGGHAGGDIRPVHFLVRPVYNIDEKNHIQPN